MRPVLRDLAPGGQRSERVNQSSSRFVGLSLLQIVAVAVCSCAAAGWQKDGASQEDVNQAESSCQDQILLQALHVKTWAGPRGRC
jgi:hypothetical protein